MNNSQDVLKTLNLESCDSAIRATQDTRLWIEDQDDKVKAANSIIEAVAGPGMYIEQPYQSRIVAQNLVADLVIQGAEFDGESALKKAIERAELMAKKYDIFANRENGVADDGIDSYEIINKEANKRINDEVKKMSNKPVIVKKKEKKVEVSAVITPKAAKERAKVEVKEVNTEKKTSKRQMGLAFYRANKDMPQKEMVLTFQKIYEIGKANAYTLYDYCRKNG